MKELELDIPDFELELDLPTEDIEQPEKEEKLEEEKVVVESDPVALTYFEELKKRGYVADDAEFKGTWEELDEYFDTLPQAVLNSVIDTYPKESKDILKFLATAGENVTVDEIKNFFKTYFEETTVSEIETVDMAREYLEKYYQNLGMKPKAITTILDQMEEDDEIIEEAKKIQEKDSSKVSKIIEDKSTENAQLKEKQRQFVSDLQTELKSTGWKKDKVERVSSLLSNKSLNERLSEVFSSPKTLVQLADFLDLYDSKKKEFNLEAYKKQVASGEVKSLKEKLEKENFSSASLSTKHINTSDKKEEDDLVPIFD